MPKGKQRRKKLWHTRTIECGICGWTAKAHVEISADQMHHAGESKRIIEGRECLQCMAEVALRVCPCVKCQVRTRIVPAGIDPNLLRNPDAAEPQGIIEATKTPLSGGKAIREVDKSRKILPFEPKTKSDESVGESANKGDSEISASIVENAAQHTPR